MEPTQTLTMRARRAATDEVVFAERRPRRLSVEKPIEAFSEEDEVTGEFPAIVIEELETAESVPNGLAKAADVKSVEAKARPPRPVRRRSIGPTT